MQVFENDTISSDLKTKYLQYIELLTWFKLISEPLHHGERKHLSSDALTLGHFTGDSNIRDAC